MKKYNISASLIRVIEHLDNKATSAVIVEGILREWFRITVGVLQGCLLSATLLNIYLDRVMTDFLEDHGDTVSIGGREITNRRLQMISMA